MKIKLLYTFAFLFAFSIYNVTGQSQKKQPLKVINYGENINAPLTEKELSFIKEVYADKAEEYVLNRPQRLKDIKHILRNRIYINEHKNKDLSHFKLLSSVPLFNDYNKELKKEVFFNANDFNVLKYSFDFYSRNENILTYRVDNTNYLVNIKPQHQ
ncbi:hypothetical protein [Lacinutrix jangbogonensis]|uniref:hypothetical protein n=1 Tax=Lacinutrix jangbogonensis TaxID=1469557 RepID=UPI00053D0136|nr:hypothetical protein [Lacinutrix jangbogonensis]